MNKFVEVHDRFSNKTLLVNLVKAETIQDGFISFSGYAINVKEDYNTLKTLLSSSLILDNADS